MKKTIKYIGLDVHKKSISIGIADEGRDEHSSISKIAHQFFHMPPYGAWRDSCFQLVV